MNEFIVSARKYRPTTFESVVGQSAITTTLKNAIQNKHMAHAYLFCGPRGVGKTTCARIFAKTINCLNPTANMEPCNECESCMAFNQDRSYNIHELDAASNNSVDDIRSLIDQVRVKPQIGNYSVYIIDEVHMLTTAAFNAFLKTLEEPPQHAVFIMATTEKHKVLPTILSRCQVFTFGRITIADAAKHLEYVAKCEGVTADPEALNIIAQKADGAMRDALSIFDQIVSFSGNEITYEKAIANLNVLDYDYFFKVVDAAIDENSYTCLDIYNDVLEKGFDGQVFLSGLSKHFRDLLVSKDERTVKLIEAGDNTRTKYLEQAKKCEPWFIFDALKTLNDAEINYRTTQNKRMVVELALIGLCNLKAEKKKENDV